jgi:Uma2 family endonuclease
MVLTPHRMVQPDVAFIATENLGILRDVIRGPADLVAEIVSPGSRRRDRVDKKDLYEQHGVKEYWVVDPEARSVDVWHLTPGRQYDLAGRFLENEEAQSRLLAGFKLSIRLLLDGE